MNTRMVQCTDGTEIEVHASYKFSPEDWERLPREERNRIINERKEYSENKRQRRTEEQTSFISSIARSVISEMRQGSNNNGDDVSTLAEGTAAPSPPRSIMGGRNEQAQLRGRNSNNSSS